jgi:1-acyl-sn-glycerol-3-phosphate acyltransferase
MSFMRAVTYRVCRHVIIGPALHVVGRPRIIGRQHIPQRGAVIVAANHLAVIDSFYLILAARRQVFFLAKADYFTRPGLVGRLQKWFFTSLGQIPVERSGGAAAKPAITAATSIVRDGNAWGIHPEGTRSPDGRMYRGRTGVMRVAMTTGVPVIPVAITGTRKTRGLRWWRRDRVVIEILPPLDLAPFVATNDCRGATDALMGLILAHTGQEYVDDYARSWTQPSPRRDAA